MQRIEGLNDIKYEVLFYIIFINYMAKIVYACLRDSADMPLVKRRIEKILPRLVPDNIPDATCKAVTHGNIVYGISTYSQLVKEKDGSVCMGVAYHMDTINWCQPGAEHPDGTYAIFRADEEYVEAITDIACNRAIWYYKDDNIFIAGTSQRAVIALAGSFDMDRRNIPWMLSAGTLTPGLSWDKKLQFVPQDGSVLLNRKTWELTVTRAPVKFNAMKISDAEIEKKFTETLIDTFKEIDIDLSQWILPISGGADSRAIAGLFKSTGKDISTLSSITWGLQASQQIKSSDGYLGGAVAKALGMPHQFMPTDEINESIEKIFERFMLCSEGRIDHILGYTDGMTMWKKFNDTGRLGILRGDENFGGPATNSYDRGRFLTQAKLCNDFANLENFIEKYGYEKQALPAYLEAQQDKESVDSYRDRFYQQFRIPVVLSALSDIKFAYTEILNPFFSRKILTFSRSMPDHLRYKRNLYFKIVKKLSLDMPFATEQATGTRENFFKSPEVINIFTRELQSENINLFFDKDFIQSILDKLHAPHKVEKTGFRKQIKKYLQRNLPVYIKEGFRQSMPKPFVDNGLLAFRIYMVSKMYSIITEDVKLVNEPEATVI